MPKKKLTGRALYESLLAQYVIMYGEKRLEPPRRLSDSDEYLTSMASRRRPIGMIKPDYEPLPICCIYLKSTKKKWLCTLFALRQLSFRHVRPTAHIVDKLTDTEIQQMAENMNRRFNTCDCEDLIEDGDDVIEDGMGWEGNLDE